MKKTIDEILKKFNCDEHHIRKVLKEQQIDRKYNSFSKELYDRIILLYELGCTQKRICEELLISTVGVVNTLKRNGIHIRTFSECNQRYKRNQHYFDKIDTPNKAYILGLLFADGNNHLNHNSITLSLQERDVAVLEVIKKELEYEGPLRYIPLNQKKANYKNHYCLNINDEYMSAKLAELGLVNAKSLILQFPNFLTKDLKSHFIRGYFDGDGCIYYDNKRNKCQTQTAGTKDFCNAISDILSSFDCKNSIKHPKQCHPNTVVLQTMGNKSSYKFLSWMYSNAEIKLDRKYQQYLLFCEKYHVK